MVEPFDAIVIGTGQAGPSLAARLVAAGRTVAVVERRDMGGTCVNTGCTPTKAWVASARAAHVARHAGALGVDVGGSVRVDMQAVKRRKDDLVLQSRHGLGEWLQGLDGCTVVDGHARFTGAKTVAIDGRTLTAEQVFINTGARPAVPDWPGLDAVPYLTNETILELEEVPEHLVVVGGSYVGLEFAQMFRRFGSAVSVVERGPDIIRREDPDVVAAIRQLFADEGIDVHTGAECLAVEGRPGAVAVRARMGDGERRIAGSHLLLAVGRRPNSDDLGLDVAGIATDARGRIEVDDRLETSVPGVFALGDVNGKGAFTHTSYDDHAIVAANLLDGGDRKVSDRILTYALFIDPPLGRAGLTEAQLRAAGHEALVATLPMARVGRARERGETAGFMKVLVDARTERILGASIFGIEGDEVVHALLAAMYAGTSYKTLRDAVPIHPTVSELLPTLLADLGPLD